MAEENVDEERVSMEEEQALGSGGEIVAEEELLGEEGVEMEGHSPEAIASPLVTKQGWASPVWLHFCDCITKWFPPQGSIFQHVTPMFHYAVQRDLLHIHMYTCLIAHMYIHIYIYIYT